MTTAMAVFDALIVVVPLVGIAVGVVLTLFGVWPAERRGGVVDLVGVKPKERR